MRLYVKLFSAIKKLPAPYNPWQTYPPSTDRENLPRDFEYVVRKQELQKIAFGSGCERDTSSKKGMTPFMRHYIYEDFPNISPTKYNPLDAFKAINTKPCPCAISRKGYSGIARFADTLNHGDDHPSPAEYSISTFPPKVKQSKYPFSSTAKRQTNSTNKNPGPGTHLPGGKRQIMYDHSFGGRVKMRLGVELKCCQRNTDICDLCQRKPLGDYWHKRNKSFLCRPCMLKEHREHKIYNAPQLKEFRKIRDCSEIHRHEGMPAKIWLMHPQVIKKWNRCEAYLSAYLID